MDQNIVSLPREKQHKKLHFVAFFSKSFYENFKFFYVKAAEYLSYCRVKGLKMGQKMVFCLYLEICSIHFLFRDFFGLKVAK